jgi:hypothetical protein
MSVELLGVREFERMLLGIRTIPDSVLTRAVKPGATLIRDKARNDAPYEHGFLKKGIKMKVERRKSGKKVYYLCMDSDMNDIFVKTARSGERYYYPASQEYGFRTKNGGYVPGAYFLKNTMSNLKSTVDRDIVEALKNNLEDTVNRLRWWIT